MDEKLKVIDGEILYIYENNSGEKMIDARELHNRLESKRRFANWINDRIEKYKFIENVDFIKRNNFVTVGNLKRPQIDYYLTIDMAKELCMIENNEIGRNIRTYFIMVEKRYREITEQPKNIFDIMHMALNKIEKNDEELRLIKIMTQENKDEIEKIKKKVDVTIRKDYCLASDIAEQLQIYSENNLPHSSFIGAIAKQLGMKIYYKHYYEDDQIAVVLDVSKGNEYYQVYYKPKAVNEIVEWFEKNKSKIEYKIIYERNTKNGSKGDIKEHGYKVEEICYKVK